ncbi:hypothetical protein Y049_4365 [Burkholderia pseudomallei MSHR684]|nr:hypothetical protein Y049_4365 [Burkholderia pseudomallei MSHR684]
MTEQDLAALSFKAAAHDMETIVRHIAERYIRQGVPLTWRLLHAVEAEALADLGFASRHDPMVRCLFDRPAELRFPETDDLVDFGQSNALPAVFSFAVAAYERAADARARHGCRAGTLPHVRRAHGATSFSPAADPGPARPARRMMARVSGGSPAAGFLPLTRKLFVERTRHAMMNCN